MKTVKSPDLRHRIMDAGIRLFAERGFFTARVEDIARRARVAKGTVYLYFKDKPSLYVGILDHQFQDGIAILKRVREQEKPAAEKLAIVARDWFEFMKQFQTGFNMSAFDNLNLTKTVMRKFHQQVLTRMHEIYQLLADIIRQGVDKGEFRPVDPVVAAHCFLNMVRTSSAAHMLLPGVKNAEREVFDIFMNGLKKPV
jgi:TetR/AcrR family fatty acid metabolism transcriptional regulator